MTSGNREYRVNVRLIFPPRVSSEPVVCQLTRLFDIDFNIIRAKITPREQGFLTLELLGCKKSCEEGIAYLKEHDIEVQYASQCVEHVTELCMDCGMCTSMCPTSAVSVDPTTRKLVFEQDKCTACGRCILVCPVRALQMVVVE